VGGQLAVVEAWLAAVDDADARAATALSAPDLEVVGPRGSTRGREVLAVWMARAASSPSASGTTTAWPARCPPRA
jgi:limonene-1,2-epoxide hydrolase